MESTMRHTLARLSLAGLAATLVLGGARAEPPAVKADAAQPEAAAPAAGEKKPCCHPKKAGDDAGLPAGMAELGEGVPAGAADAGPALPPPVTVKVKDTPLLDQDGRSVRFKSDVVGDRLVVVDFVFTTCTTICPILSSRLARVQEKLGDRLGRDVRLVSVSIDPERDTPERLKAYAARFKAREGWTWVTGDVEQVNDLLKGLGAYTPDYTAHAPMMMVADGRTGRWSRFNGFPDPDRLVAALDALAAARTSTASRE